MGAATAGTDPLRPGASRPALCSLLNHLPARDLRFGARAVGGCAPCRGGPRSTPRPSLRPSPPAPLHFGPFICCVLLFGGSPRRAGKAAQCRQEEEEGWGEARPELCQMWERREGGTLAARSLPPLLPLRAAGLGDPIPGGTRRCHRAGGERGGSARRGGAG